MNQTTEKHSRLSRLASWAAELLLVFVGVYAAFWLNNYEQGKEQAKRRDQILAYLEQRLEDGITSAKSDGAKEEKLIAAFKHSLDAGEMPPLRPFSFSTECLNAAINFSSLAPSLLALVMPSSNRCSR